jgi:hypothetical protein
MHLKSANKYDAVSLAVLPELRVCLLLALVFVAIAWVGSATAYAQVAEVSTVVVDPGASARKVRFMLEVNRQGFVLPPVDVASPPTGQALRSDRFLQAPSSTRSKPRARSTKRIVAGAIVGGVGGFFAGGFLGAHIEGDRCNCDDPGVRGFLIGAPIGAVTGAIAGAKKLF